MRTLIVFLLSYASVFGADGDMRIFTTAQTNAQTGSIITQDFFTRDGQTNLERRTYAQAGVVQKRIHLFRHAGSVLAEHFATPDSSSYFVTEAGTPYSVILESDATRNPRSVVIRTGVVSIISDIFLCTNGLFSPVESSVLTKANAIGSPLGEGRMK